MKIHPLNDKIVLSPIEHDTVSISGIILGSTEGQKISKYKVINGAKLVQDDYIVICSQHAGYDLEGEDGEKYKIVDYDSLLAIYEEDKEEAA